MEASLKCMLQYNVCSKFNWYSQISYSAKDERFIIIYTRTRKPRGRQVLHPPLKLSIAEQGIFPKCQEHSHTAHAHDNWRVVRISTMEDAIASQQKDRKPGEVGVVNIWSYQL